MALKSNLFKGDTALEACLISDPAHVMPGASGNHVAKIQEALFMIDSCIIATTELSVKNYGPSTASAVLSFKRKRNIINRAYQSSPDNIVGKMTIAALDNEVFAAENKSSEQPDLRNWGVTTSKRNY